MEERAPQNGCFFHPFCCVYYYPCVQCRMEPIYSATFVGASQFNDNGLFDEENGGIDGVLPTIYSVTFVVSSLSSANGSIY